MIAPAVSTSVRFVVPGPPVSWARAGRGMGARTGGAYVTFTPAKQRSWKTGSVTPRRRITCIT